MELDNLHTKKSLHIYSHFTRRTNLEVGRFDIIISISQMRNSELMCIINGQFFKMRVKDLEKKPLVSYEIFIRNKNEVGITF